jgi:hypothetical protein
MTQANRWYPTEDKLNDPRQLRAVLKQVLDQHYALQDQFNQYKKDNPQQAPQDLTANHGPSDTMILGLRVAPVDTQTLANGVSLKFNKAAGNFQFS